MISFDAAHAAFHYLPDRRFRIWIRPSVLTGIMIAIGVPIAAGHGSRPAFGGSRTYLSFAKIGTHRSDCPSWWTSSSLRTAGGVICLCPFCSDNAVMLTADIFCLIKALGDCSNGTAAQSKIAQ
jgi:hypothetical protein